MSDPIATERDRRQPAPSVAMVHLAIRFLLELACWGSVGYWAWRRFDGGLAGVIAGALAFSAVAMAWGAFKTPGEIGPKPLVAVPGWARLLLELAIFGLAAAALWSAWSRAASETLMTALVLHVAVTWERHWWLLRAPRTPPAEG